MADGVVRRIFQAVFGKKIAGTRIFPITTKIIIIFTLFMIGSNITTNYINLVFSREEMSKLLKELLVKDLRELYSYLNNQHEIYRFNNDLKQVVGQIEENPGVISARPVRWRSVSRRTARSFCGDRFDKYRQPREQGRFGGGRRNDTQPQ